MILLFQEGTFQKIQWFSRKISTVFALRFYESLDSNFFTLHFVLVLSCYSMICSVIVKLSSPFPYSFTHSPESSPLNQTFILSFNSEFQSILPHIETGPKLCGGSVCSYLHKTQLDLIHRFLW